ncbi:hypothetical protein FB563_2670 [Streptomyces puniciscabiei]|uniref:Phosphopantetheine binding protein n=1 Tax=Streptomyces puniciscabiei TaxID=164348 RepID=A0A542UF25_9ACTN|nr:hypothetical protein [Streptomyces puniciscabiei]TQK97690.1 hypothetical protein FB563_2670 [Streptomyces puniciscabiei]
MITRGDIERLLVDSGITPEPGPDGPDEFVLDSLTLVWMLHLLDERHGIRWEPAEEDLVDFTSVSGAQAVLARSFPGRVEQEEVTHGS